MSLTRSTELVAVAKEVCRTLRRNYTTAEAILWEALRGRRLLDLKFLRQHPIFVDVDGKETFFVVDFYCARCRLAVEVDGRIHDYRMSSDSARTSVLRDLGVSVIRLKNEDIEDHLTLVLDNLRNHLHPQDP